MTFIQPFVQRLFAPRRKLSLFIEGEPIGRELVGEWRLMLEYRLAELGYGLRSDIRLRGMPTPAGEPGGRAQLQEGVLFVDAGAVEGRRFRPEFLALDLPHAFIDRPVCLTGDTPEE